jgi:RNA polymerase sigma factor (sigma-70 family)
VTATSARAEQIATFYARHAHRLRRTVAANAHAPEQTIEDACQNAWAILLRHPGVTLEHGGFAWLATVAIREAWRLASRPREVPVGAYLPGDPEPGIVPEPPGDTADPADRAIAREQHSQRVNDFARLKPREREALYLKALGHSYQEIAALTNASYTAVNRRINEGRARLRKLARERDALTGGGGEEGGEHPPQGA